MHTHLQWAQEWLQERKSGAVAERVKWSTVSSKLKVNSSTERRGTAKEEWKKGEKGKPLQHSNLITTAKKKVLIKILLYSLSVDKESRQGADVCGQVRREQGRQRDTANKWQTNWRRRIKDDSQKENRCLVCNCPNPLGRTTANTRWHCVNSGVGLPAVHLTQTRQYNRKCICKQLEETAVRPKEAPAFKVINQVINYSLRVSKW